MKKSMVAFLLVPLLAMACHGRSVDMPKSPFQGDGYTPIGVESEFSEKLNPLDEEGEEYQRLRQTVNHYQEQEQDDIVATKYTRKREYRDLKHAYFGDQEQNLCSYVSQEVVDGYYLNPNDNGDLVSIDKNYEVNKRQTISGGIKTNSSRVETYDYTDLQKSANEDKTYSEIKSTKINQEKAEVTQTISGAAYDHTVFQLTPYATYITMHFSDDFPLFGENNNAAYGKFKDGRFLIKEAHSDYNDYATLGHKYKAVKNYFYEGVLAKISETNLGFTSFRFYSELLILSEAADSDDVPVLYLERPMLVEYDEYKYEISYSPLGKFDRSKIPHPTKS